ncbi:MAG: methionyl-tRNA formyltransferase [Eggerthellaceae bacterium]|nr:methionyl-tRNA formyltransferase [Eggerthellaceae bacterium]
MRIIFMGTSEFSARILETLVSQHEILAVYTKADSYRRGGKLKISSPVSKLSESLGLEIENPDSLKNAQVLKQLHKLDPECICVAAYGHLLPKQVLELPKFGCLNVHASLLPQWRGAAPIQRSILSGQKTTGVSIMRMEEGLDTGPYANQRELEIGDLHFVELETKLAELGANSLLKSLEELCAGILNFEAQDEAKATYANKIGKQELCISPEDTSLHAFTKFRASNSANPCRCKLVGKEVSITGLSEISDDLANEIEHNFSIADAQGKLVLFQKRLFIGFYDTWLELLEFVPSGKKVISASTFASGIQGIKKNPLQWEAV